MGGDGGAHEGPQPVGGQEEGYRSEAYSFDSSALERAAKAAKDLEKSKFAKEALALSQKQEETKQQEQMVKIKKYEMSMIMEKVKDSQEQHKQKMSWLSEEENRENRQVAYRMPGFAQPNISQTVAQLGFTARDFRDS